MKKIKRLILQNLITMKNIKKNKQIIKSNDFVLTDKEANELAVHLIKAHLKEELDFHIKNFETNKIKWKKER